MTDQHASNGSGTHELYTTTTVDESPPMTSKTTVPATTAPERYKGWKTDVLRAMLRTDPALKPAELLRAFNEQHPDEPTAFSTVMNAYTTYHQTAKKPAKAVPHADQATQPVTPVDGPTTAVVSAPGSSLSAEPTMAEFWGVRQWLKSAGLQARQIAPLFALPVRPEAAAAAVQMLAEMEEDARG